MKNESVLQRSIRGQLEEVTRLVSSLFCNKKKCLRGGRESIVLLLKHINLTLK